MVRVLNVIFAVPFSKLNNPMDNMEYSQSTIEKRQAREKHLIAAPRNWFSLVGLFPLVEGNNFLGGSVRGNILIPGAPQESYAILELVDGKVTLSQSSATFFINDKPAEPCQIRSDHDPEPDLMSIGAIQIMLLQRGERFFLRAWDTQSARARDFKGLSYFEIDPDFHITARYIPFSEPRALPIEDAIGTNFTVNFSGRADFAIAGVHCSLIAQEDEDGLLFSFKDLTSQDSTYPAGRYVLTDPPDGDHIVIDFNLAYNWPCAYTPYATCPLPPSENHLKVRIEAGEKRYPDDN